MKSSNYNIKVQLDDNKSIIFNTFTRKFFICSNNNLDKVDLIINNPELYQQNERISSFLTKLTNGGFIIPDDYNEISYLEKKYNQFKEEAEYTLLIMSTYSCNFSCWYCTQEHKNVSLNSQTENAIKEHIKSYLINNGISKFHISWFGGEPLLNFDYISSISHFAKEFCCQHNIDFSCGITTNGSMLNKEIIFKMKSLNFVNFQITIDGTKEFHNKTRYNKAIKDSFTLLLNNIKDLVLSIPNAILTLRINYTRYNLSKNIIKEIDQVLNPVRSKIYILFRKVWQEPENTEMANMVSYLSMHFDKLGYQIKHDFDNINLLSCYVEKRHFLSIFPDGKVDRCNNKDLSEARGYLNKDGNVIWTQKPNDLNLSVFSKKFECSNCKYFPICLGPCPRRREKTKQNKFVKCYISDKDNIFTQEIIEYCKAKADYKL